MNNGQIDAELHWQLCIPVLQGYFIPAVDVGPLSTIFSHIYINTPVRNNVKIF